ncbi:hypothetical protein BGZ65_004609 [Modicella reniformis]|uniref:Pentatricopeptide repeat-containing protein n=1 Tax=Modicella reniformis TaxID=1440133 RepID=A0A9P6IYB2_9FUNG|nr:hypothetical protein BGZ65_004609 [Modicella reniformis]
MPKDPYLLSKEIVKLAKKGRLDDAIALVLETHKSLQNDVVWNHLIQEASKLGKPNQSWRLLNDMKKRGVELNERTYTILLNALAINPSSPDSISRAKALYHEMQESEDTPPTIAHTNALLKVCARGDQGFEKAWKVWEDCLEAKMKRSEEVELDPSLIDAVLLACREAESVSLAKRGRRIVESLYGLSLPISRPTAAAAARSKSIEPEAMSATERAISPGKGFGLGPILQKEIIRPRTVELILAIRTKFKDYAKAEQFMDLVRTTYPDFKPDAQLLASLMHLQIIRKEYGKAIQTWDEIKMLGLQHTPATFKQGLDASLKANNWKKTLEMYTEMKNLIEKNRGVSTKIHRPVNPIVDYHDAWTLVSTVKCAVRTKHILQAVQILQESKWTKVVQTPQYPRANADLAELAIKVYTLALRKAKSSQGHESLTNQGNVTEVKILERELQKAEELQATLSETLARYDDKKTRKGEEEEEDTMNQKAQNVSAGFTSRSSLRKVEHKAKSNWQETFASGESSHDCEKKQRAYRSSARRDASRRNGIKSSLTKGSPRRSKSGEDQLEAAFRLSKHLTRKVL